MLVPRLRSVPPRLGRFGAATMTMIVCLSVAAPASHATPVVAGPTTDSPATSAWDLIDSVGVNVHMNYSDTAYSRTATVIGLLQKLGVSHIRDGINPHRADTTRTLTQLGRAGMGLTLVAGRPSVSGPNALDTSQTLALTQLASYIDALESPNEYDCSGDPDWVARLRSFNASAAATFAGKSKLRDLPVLGPSFCRSPSAAQYGAIAPMADVANIHNYSGAVIPELAVEGRVADYRASQGSTLPAQITETGYSNATATSGAGAQDEQTAADYTLRMLLDTKAVGVDRTFLYELFDEKPNTSLTDPEQHFGLVRNDGSVKPAYTAIKNLLRDVAQGRDPRTLRPGGPSQSNLDVRLNGGGTLLRSLRIADPVGGGETIALWLAQPLSSGAQMGPGARVQVTTGAATSATTQRPSRGNLTAQLGINSSFDIAVDGAVTLVHLVPAAQPVAANGRGAAGAYESWATAHGAVAFDDLSTGSGGWSGSPQVDPSSPAGIPPGVRISASNQTRRVAVPSGSTSWTITFWVKIGADSTNGADILRADGLRGGLIRTYDLQSDLPTHMQLSAYGLPNGNPEWGNEVWGNALPTQWYLVSLSNGGGRAALAINGVPAGTAPSSNAPLTALSIGSLNGGFRGSVAMVAVFGSVLSTEDLTALATLPGQR